ncbi:glycoside hydrolase domain-containing protein [Chromatocurvus halotolerans]|uniref:Putative alpha-1,2-mannosidase n=1 Tax=Chromatocurvus halotolerans TaxID=1132028 RepID=A0A4R2KUS8_9GAMM|nr:glycoside hydrolase domain-containing protein [Chromatocurvus halotolerans]TCO76652.1 putative alpha-1,2-mannosidase [Chromatocurvus halotolerans]
MRRLNVFFLLSLSLPVLATDTPARLVDPFVGTLSDFGQLSPAAVAPYGMVQLGPDTNAANHAGYDYAATELLGLSHTRAVGVGCGGAGGDLRISLHYADFPDSKRIDKSTELASAGYYRVGYGNGLIAEATATRGAGILRFTVPRTGKVDLAIDPRPAYADRIAAHWDNTQADDLRATLRAGTVCNVGSYTLYTASVIRHQGKVPEGVITIDDDGVASLQLSAEAGDTIEVRTGLSSVDSTAAAAVRRAELANRVLEEVAAATMAKWEEELGRISIEAPKEQRALFYTSLFRVMQTPVAIADPDGRYRGSDGQLKRVDDGQQRYTSWALWDNYRTQLPLIGLIDPARAGDIARSLAALYDEGKHRWATGTEPFLTVRTEHAGVALLDFYRKGITNFDARAALTNMVTESPSLVRRTPDERIEAAYDDWAIAELAKELGDTATSDRFRSQALEYRDDWLQVFDQLDDDADVVGARGLYQGTIWQYRWAPVFDLPWLADTLAERLRPELAQFFNDNLYNMTNQPSIHVPWMLSWSGDRSATAAIVRRYLNESVDHGYTNAGKRSTPWHGPSFALAPQGFADGMDDDAGTMSAWYVWGSLGLYPLIPGKPEYVIGLPTVCRAVISTGKDQQVHIAVSRSLDSGPPAFEGEPIESNQIEHASLVAGGVLHFSSSRDMACENVTRPDPD